MQTNRGSCVVSETEFESQLGPIHETDTKELTLSRLQRQDKEWLLPQRTQELR
jgi:hypothetical protein